MLRFRNIISMAILVAISLPLSVQSQSDLNLDRIFTKYEFSPEWLGPIRWFDEGESYIRLEKSASHPSAKDLVKYNTVSGDKVVLIPASSLIPEGKQEPLSIENYYWSPDKSKLLIFTNSQRVWRYNTRGDYWVYDTQKKTLKQLGGSDAKPSTLMFAKFSPDGQKVAYVREHNIYVEPLASDEIVQLTSDGSERIINGTFDWAYEEEFDCRDGFKWSPDSKAIAYWRIDATSIRNFYMINNTDSAYSQIIPVQYPKAGETPSECKAGVVSAAGGPTTWMHMSGDPRQNYIPRMIWTPDSKSVLMQHLNRAQNHNRVTRGDVKMGNVKVIFEDKETAWLDVVNDFQYLNNGKNFTWVSEKSGWKAAYAISADGKTEQRITPEGQDMIEIKLIDEKGGWLYYIASPDNATQRYLYRTKLSGKSKQQKISPDAQAGTHEYDITPNGKYAVHTFSKAGVPPVTNLISLPDHKVIRNLVSNEKLKAKIDALDKQPMEFFTVDVEEGVSLDAYMIKPPDFDPSKKYPVLFYVYGEPWNQTVLDSWGGSTYLWHLMLTQQGYIVMSVDNRGTPGPKGRDFRKCVYGQIGVLSSADQAAAVKKIINNYSFVDSDRIGIWGWSGGGAMTLNAMFRYPDIYKVGMSVAPVTNQLLYDNIYQERYSGIPSVNPEGYEKGSPINFAKNLKGDLLLVHGTGDDNVHYQHTEMLINELVKYNKLFSLMSYPNRSHGIYEGENTSRHLRETLTHYLMTHLPAGPK